MKARIIILAITVVLLSACSKEFPNGHITTQTRNIKGFTSVELANSSDVVINTGSPFYVELKGSDNLINNIETVVKGGRLVIKTTPGLHIGNNDVSLYIEMPYLDEIRSTGSGNMEALCDSSSGHLGMTISGSGDIRVSGMNVKDVSVNISGSGNAVLTSRFAGKLNTVISGSGAIHAFGLSSDTAYTSTSGSGNTEISISDYLNAKITGSGDVIYDGSPEIKQALSGSGRVRKR